MSKRKNWKQLTLESARKAQGRGGWRPGAGRPKGRTTTPHDIRPELVARYPLHVTWRTGPNAPLLRGFYPNKFIQDEIRATNRDQFRVVEYSIQSNHIHMMIEASSKDELTRGMRGLARRITARMKTKFTWKGRLLERFHARPLKTPCEVRNALRYVLLNMRHHVGPGVKQDPFWIDPYSSAYWFDGWRRPVIGNQELVERYAGLRRPTAGPRTWLLSVGWRRWGLLEFDEIPGA